MESPWETLSLSALATRIWTTLAQAIDEPANPWRTPVLATSGPAGPNARTVVLRGVTRPGYELLAFSDARTAKVVELTAEPRAAWLFYDPQERVQLRAVTTVRLHTADAVAQRYWHRLPAVNRCQYQSANPPGRTVAAPADGHILTPGDAGHLTVIVATVEALDWLWLGPEQHRRARFARQAGEWCGGWQVP